MQMPFGKFFGWRIADIDTQYLQWVLRDCTNIAPALREAIDAELQARAGRRQPDAPPRSRARSPITAAGLDAWKRAWPALVRVAHPDAGGDAELMVVLNSINERFEEARRRSDGD